MNTVANYLTTIRKLVESDTDKAAYIDDEEIIGWIRNPKNRMELIQQGFIVRAGRKTGELLVHDKNLSNDEITGFMSRNASLPATKVLTITTKSIASAD